MSEHQFEIAKIMLDKGVLAIILAVFGFFVNRAIERFKNEQAVKKEHEVLRDKTALLHLQRQIEELYSPMLGLIEHITRIFDVYDAKKQTLNTERLAELERYFTEKYFLDMNLQIAILIRSKIYLIDYEGLPDSYLDFLEHQAQFATQYNLWKDMGISSDEIVGKGWPMNFSSDVRKTLDRLRSHYNFHLQNLQKAEPGVITQELNGSVANPAYVKRFESDEIASDESAMDNVFSSRIA